MGEPKPEEVWVSRTGTPVVIIGVDEERLALLYALEAEVGDGALGLFTEAYDTANLRTRNAWSYGYKNPRTTITVRDCDPDCLCSACIHDRAKARNPRTTDPEETTP